MAGMRVVRDRHMPRITPSYLLGDWVDSIETIIETMY